MFGEDAQLIQKVTAHEAELVAIYRDAYLALKAADRAKLPENVIAELDSLDAPETISPAKAAAILKSIIGSTPKDKFHFEYCYGERMPDGKMIGGYVKHRLKEVGIEYHDFWPYLKVHGWLLEE